MVVLSRYVSMVVHKDANTSAASLAIAQENALAIVDASLIQCFFALDMADVLAQDTTPQTSLANPSSRHYDANSTAAEVIQNVVLTTLPSDESPDCFVKQQSRVDTRVGIAGAAVLNTSARANSAAASAAGDSGAADSILEEAYMRFARLNYPLYMDALRGIAGGL